MKFYSINTIIKAEYSYITSDHHIKISVSLSSLTRFLINLSQVATVVKIVEKLTSKQELLIEVQQMFYALLNNIPFQRFFDVIFLATFSVKVPIISTE